MTTDQLPSAIGQDVKKQLVDQLVGLKQKLLESIAQVTAFPEAYLWEGGLQASSRIHRTSAWRDLDHLGKAGENSEELEHLRAFIVAISWLMPEVFAVRTKLVRTCDGQYSQANLEATKQLELAATEILAIGHQLLAIHYADT